MKPAASLAAVSYVLDDSLLARLRRRAVALTVALRLGDHGAASIVAERLRRSVADGEALIKARTLPVAHAATIASHVRAARRLIERAPAKVAASELHRWMAAPPSMGSAGSGADLFDLDGRGADLERAQLGQLHLLQCQLAGAKLYGANVEGAMLDSCDLTSIDARASRWRDAVILRGRLQGAAFAGADLEGAMFSDCDLRGADLSCPPGTSGRPGASGGAGASGKAARSIWIRCDLRNTVWTHRALTDAHFVSCRLADARDLRLGDGGSAVRCEPSPRGEPGEPAELAGWNEADALGGEPTLRDEARAEALARGMCEATENDVAVRREEAAARARGMRRGMVAPAPLVSARAEIVTRELRG